MQPLVVFASGTGTNTRAIIDYFKQNNLAKVALIVCNKPEAGVLQIAKDEQIPTLIVNKQTISNLETIDTIKSYNPSFIVLAGFLWKIPLSLLEVFSNNIINIHPALLPKYGGKGMYGHYVHNAVIAAGDTQSGITIHLVNEVYDSGDILMQARCFVHETDTAEDLAGKVHALEHYYYPRVIKFLLKRI